MAEPLKLDWSQAAVKDGTLSVALSGQPPEKWRASFETAAVLLSHDRLAVKLSSKGAIKVSRVQSGDEESIREFVEGCVLQANSTIVDDDELYGRDALPTDEEDDESDARPSDEAAEPVHDDALTEHFQAFGEPDA